MSLNSVLKKRKKKKQIETDNIRDYIFTTVNELTEKKFNEQFGLLKEGTKGVLEIEIKKSLDTVKDGKDGRDGKNGRAGKVGRDGNDAKSPTKSFLRSLIKPLIPKPKKGDPGESIKGDKGNDGSSDKPKDIIKKLNTLENILDVKVLKGLKPILKSIQDSIGSMKKGGGMSMPQHEEHALSSATTTITLSYNVASSGYAIWVYYNGQAVSRNDANGYSISGKTIALGFTPQDNTYLDIIYFRS